MAQCPWNATVVRFCFGNNNADATGSLSLRLDELMLKVVNKLKRAFSVVDYMFDHSSEKRL